MIIVLLYIVLKNITTKTPVAFGTHALQSQPTALVCSLLADN